MNPKILNPDSVVLGQLDGQWQKLAMMILWKFNKGEPVTITAHDMESMINAHAPGLPVLMTMGAIDGITFQVIDEKRASVLAKHDAQQRGTA